MIYGINTDKCGRCVHYHTKNDIVALECGRCHQFFACYQCHDQLRDHKFVPMPVKNTRPIQCGNCGYRLTIDQYQTYQCPQCGHEFNYKCSKHKNIYFKN